MDMYGSGRGLRFFLGFLVVVLVLFLVIVLIVRGGGSDSKKVQETKKTLMSYVDNPAVTVTQTVIGPVQASQNHDQATITVSNSSSVMTIYKGYDGSVVDSKSYPMNQTSFGEFLKALDRAGYTRGNTPEELKDDRGFCPLGSRYIFTISEGGNELQRYWATSCGGTRTYNGNLSLTRALFKNQVPDYYTMVNNANKNSGTVLSL